MFHTRIGILLVSLALGTGVQADDDLPSQVARCQAIAMASTRLACFDALPRLAVTSPQSTVTAPTKPATPVQASAEGRTPAVATTPAVTVATTAPPPPFPRTATIERISRTIDNRQVFYLDDGSIWRETRTSRSVYKPGTTVTIEESGVLGTDNWKRYRLKIGNRSFSVVEVDRDE
ncbi:MAG: hypothetical protein ACFHX7_25330 [Pseudomonadota bacterium]